MLLAFVYWASQNMPVTYTMAARGFLGVILFYAVVMVFIGVDKNHWLKKWRKDDPHALRSILTW